MVELWKSVSDFFSSRCCYNCSIMSFVSTAHYFMELLFFFIVLCQKVSKHTTKH